MVDRSMRGLFPILAMPFDSRDDIDVEDLQREVDFAIDAAGVAPALMARIARESENVCYAKVETPPTPPRIAETVAEAGDDLIVLGGMSGAFLIEEMRRGSVGTMPHCHIPDMFRRVIDLFTAGREDEAEREFNRYTPLFRLHGAHVNKEVLRLRGVFKSSRLRHPVLPTADLTLRELQRLVEELGLAGTR